LSNGAFEEVGSASSDLGVLLSGRDGNQICQTTNVKSTAVGFPEEFIKSISIRNRDVSSEGLKSIGDL